MTKLVQMVETVKIYLNVGLIKTLAKKFKACWKNPFKSWDSFVEAIGITAELFIAVVKSVEKAKNETVDIINNGEDKLGVAVAILFDEVKFPFWLRCLPFSGWLRVQILRILVSIVVAFLNIFKKWED